MDNITRSSQAKAVQASKMGSTSHWLMLFTRTLQIQRVFEQNGRTEEMKRWTGRDPSPLELSERSSRRQIGPAHRFIDEEEEIFATTEELPTSTLPLSHFSKPPKAKKDWDQLIHKAFEILKKAKELKSRVSIESLQKSDGNVEEEVKQDTCWYKITISNQFSSECSSLQIANRRTCHHIVWSLLNLCHINDGTQLLAQVDISRSVLGNLILKVRHEIPDKLTRIHLDQTYNDKLINHPPFQRDQM